VAPNANQVEPLHEDNVIYLPPDIFGSDSETDQQLDELNNAKLEAFTHDLISDMQKSNTSILSTQLDPKLEEEARRHMKVDAKHKPLP